MEIACSLIICLVLLLEIIGPAIKNARHRNEANLEQRFFLTKLRIVRRFYPQLSELTYCEILDRYDVDALYDNLGRGSANRI